MNLNFCDNVVCVIADTLPILNEFELLHIYRYIPICIHICTEIYVSIFLHTPRCLHCHCHCSSLVCLSLTLQQNPGGALFGVCLCIFVSVYLCVWICVFVFVYLLFMCGVSVTWQHCQQNPGGASSGGEQKMCKKPREDNQLWLTTQSTSGGISYKARLWELSPDQQSPNVQRYFDQLLISTMKSDVCKVGGKITRDASDQKLIS